MEQLSEQETEYLPELIRILVNASMNIERQKHLGAGWHERTPERQGHANGYKSKTVQTRVGDITFDIPQVREGGFYPGALEKELRSERALTLFAYELQRRIRAAGKSVQVLVCHPGASRTNLLKNTASVFNKIVWSILSCIIAQSAEKGSWPEVMCATEEDLESERYYGPTKRSQTVGPVGECPLDEVSLLILNGSSL